MCAAAVGASSKDCLDYLKSYSTTRKGSLDFFRAVENVLGYSPYFFSGQSTLDALQHMRSGADLAGAALSFPTLFENVHDLRKHYSVWTTSTKAEESSAAFNELVKEGFNTTNTISQGTVALHSAKIVDLGAAFPVVNAILQGTTIITDGWDLIDQFMQNSQSDLESQLKMFKIAKFASSVAMAAILLISVFYAALAESLVLVLLAVSTIFVVSSILCFVWQEMINDKEKSPQLI